MAEQPEAKYGLSTNLFVTRKASGESIVLGGIAADESRWIRILSYRAAQLLWLQLTRLLYPEKAEEMAAWTTTAPIRDASLPTVTTHIDVNEVDEGYELAGWAHRRIVWTALLAEVEARRFWALLDETL